MNHRHKVLIHEPYENGNETLLKSSDIDFKNGRLMTSRCVFVFKSTSIEESKSVL